MRQGPRLLQLQGLSKRMMSPDWAYFITWRARVTGGSAVRVFCISMCNQALPCCLPPLLPFPPALPCPAPLPATPATLSPCPAALPATPASLCPCPLSRPPAPSSCAVQSAVLDEARVRESAAAGRERATAQDVQKMTPMLLVRWCLVYVSIGLGSWGAQILFELIIGAEMTEGLAIKLVKPTATLLRPLFIQLTAGTARRCGIVGSLS